MTALYAYWLIINIVTFCAFALDKYRAVRGLWRISEATLLGLSLGGGALGGCVAMYLFRHKTRKARFAIGLPLMTALHAVFLFVLMVN